MDKETAREVIHAAFRSGAELEKLLPLLKQRCNAADYLEYSRRIATAITDIDSALVDKVLAQFPDLGAEVEANITAGGRTMP